MLGQLGPTTSPGRAALLPGSPPAGRASGEEEVLPPGGQRSLKAEPGKARLAALIASFRGAMPTFSTCPRDASLTLVPGYTMTFCRVLCNRDRAGALASVQQGRRILLCLSPPLCPHPTVILWPPEEVGFHSGRAGGKSG